MWRLILTLPVVLACFASQASLEAAAQDYDFRSMSKEEIKPIPILDRHHRPGHFYGNTVRRRYSRGVSRFYDEYGNPTNRIAVRMEDRM